MISSFNRTSNNYVTDCELNISLYFNDEVNPSEDIEILNKIHKENKLSIDGWPCFMAAKQEIKEWKVDFLKFCFAFKIYNNNAVTKL